MKAVFSVIASAVFLLFGNLPQAQAVVLDWDTATWSPQGSLVQSFDVDPSYAGNDIRITITRNTNILVANYPRLDNDLTGGLTPAEMALRLQIDGNNRNQYITVTIDFLNPAGVSNVSFSIFDIDVGTGSPGNYSWQDQIRNIQASFGSTTYNPTFTDVGSGVTVSGNTLTGNSNIPNDSSQGNATVSFNNGPITRITFDYGSGPNAQGNPANHGIAISDIRFNDISAVPEIDSLWVTFGALLAAGIYQARRRRFVSSSLD